MEKRSDDIVFCQRCRAQIELHYPGGYPQWHHVKFPKFPHKAVPPEA